MQFKYKPFGKLMTEFGIIKFDSEGFYTARTEEAKAFLTYAKGVEQVKTTATDGVESKPALKDTPKKRPSIRQRSE